MKCGLFWEFIFFTICGRTILNQGMLLWRERECIFDFIIITCLTWSSVFKLTAKVTFTLSRIIINPEDLFYNFWCLIQVFFFPFVALTLPLILLPFHHNKNKPSLSLRDNAGGWTVSEEKNPKKLSHAFMDYRPFYK